MRLARQVLRTVLPGALLLIVRPPALSEQPNSQVRNSAKNSVSDSLQNAPGAQQPLCDRDQVRLGVERQNRRNSRKNSVLVIQTAAAGETYVAGLDPDTGALKIIRAPFLEMEDALDAALQPEVAAQKFESYQFWVRENPGWTRGLQGFASLLMLHDFNRQESMFGSDFLSNTPGYLSFSEVKSTIQLVDNRFPTAEKSPFYTRVDAAGARTLLSSHILYCYYNDPLSKQPTTRIFFYRKAPIEMLQKLRATPLAGPETISAYITDTLVAVPEAPLSLDEADEIIAIGQKGTVITPSLMRQVRSKVEAKHALEQQALANEAARKAAERIDFERTHVYTCETQEYYCPLGALVGTMCQSPLTGPIAAATRPVCSWKKK